jgi:hypothetical protein
VANAQALRANAGNWGSDHDGTGRRHRTRDLVLARGVAGVVAVEQDGGDLPDLTPSGLWLSDYVGVVAQLQIRLSPGDQ